MLKSIGEPTKIKAVCWDFDGTIPDRLHVHNWIMELINNGASRQEAIEKFLKEELSPFLFSNTASLAKSILKIHDTGTPQVIVTYNAFPEVVKPTIACALRAFMMKPVYEMSGLHKEQSIGFAQDPELDALIEKMVSGIEKVIEDVLDKVTIIAGFPTKQGLPKLNASDKERDFHIGKHQHLSIVKKGLGIKSNNQLLLIDDDKLIIGHARALGYQTVLVNSYGLHFDSIQELLNLPKDEEEVVEMPQHPTQMLVVDEVPYQLRDKPPFQGFAPGFNRQRFANCQREFLSHSASEIGHKADLTDIPLFRSH